MSATGTNTILLQPEMNEPLARLRNAFAAGRLTLYVGAGLSLASGLPSWNTLIATLYYSAVMADWIQPWKPYPNYLFALAEWLLKQSGEAPEVVAGKVASYYEQPTNGESNSRFEQDFLRILYSPWEQAGIIQTPPSAALRNGNGLLDAVANLCESTTARQGLYGLVTTNYDYLLEKAIESGTAVGRFHPVWKSEQLPDGEGRAGSEKKGIFHVHGYLPPPGYNPRSPFREIMLTEANYHAASSDVYSWSNLCMIRCFSSSVGLVIGMSLTDRNLRRLLYALKNTNLLDDVYLILKEPQPPVMAYCDTEAIHEKAKQYASRFSSSGVSRATEVNEKLNTILDAVYVQEKNIAQSALTALGVKVIWVSNHREIPPLLDAIHSPG
jgi:SIR2-like domain